MTYEKFFSAIKTVVAGFNASLRLVNLESNEPLSSSPSDLLIGLYYESPFEEILDHIIEHKIKHVINMSDNAWPNHLSIALEMHINKKFVEKFESKISWSLNRTISIKKFNYSPHYTDLIPPFTFTFKPKFSPRKMDIMEQVEHFCNLLPKSSRMKNDILLIADELFTNATYNAPFSSPFDDKICPISRTVPLVPYHIYPFTMYLNHNTHLNQVEIICRDEFGSMDPWAILRCVQNTYKEGVSESMRLSHGGARLGYRLMFEKCRSIILYVDRAKKTSVVFTVSLKRLTEPERAKKNIHIEWLGDKEELMKSFSYKESKKEGALLLQFTGSLDEDANLPEIDFNGVKEIVFDFQNLTLINSCGIREWVVWMRALPDNLFIRFIKCPPILIDQINMIEGIIKDKAIIESFYIPYYCEACDETSNHLLVKGKHYKNKADCSPSETETCPHCEGKAEIDIIEAKYLKFLERFN